MPKSPANKNPSAKAKAEKELCEAFLLSRSVEEMRRFLYDLCTPKEIHDLADRWWVARLLDEGKHSYRDIHSLTGVSLTTIGRVARFLQQENFKGYRLAIDRTKAKR